MIVNCGEHMAAACLTSVHHCKEGEAPPGGVRVSVALDASLTASFKTSLAAVFVMIGGDARDESCCRSGWF
jgi:hypothetical protein